MSHSITPDTLVVIADGGKARLLRNTGSANEIRLHEDAHLTLKDFSNDGPSGSRPGEQSPKQTGEATFAKQLVRRLESMHQQGKFAHLVLAADPQTLGQMRDAMSKGMTDSVVFSMPKDWTNHPVQDIADALS